MHISIFFAMLFRHKSFCKYRYDNSMKLSIKDRQAARLISLDLKKDILTLRSTSYSDLPNSVRLATH